MTCRHAHLDAAYVLGALSPSERAQFHDHLPGCRPCADAVRDLAGLPGLLARIPADSVPGALEPPPESLLPRLAVEARRHRRRRRVLAGAAAAAAVVSAGAGSYALGHARSSAPPPVPAAGVVREMTPVGSDAHVEADVTLTSVPWGTRLDLSCLDRDQPGEGPEEYTLVVETRDGAVQQVASWRALPGATARLAAATASTTADIAVVEVRTAEGETLLRASASG